MSNAVKKKVYEIIRKYGLQSISFDNLSEAVENMGYTIILFEKYTNNTDVQTIIDNLGLQEYIQHSRGFTYADNNYRLLFLNDSLTCDEKMLVLAHETGHIVFNHIKSGVIIGNDVKEEFVANEFAHYLLNPGLILNAGIKIAFHRKAVVGISIALAIVILTELRIMTAKKQQSYYGNYYITTTGDKYHKKECIFVKNKKNVKRLTKDEFNSGEYEACDMCLPDY